jgi:hypothetical protein
MFLCTLGAQREMVLIAQFTFSQHLATPWCVVRRPPR